MTTTSPHLGGMEKRLRVKEVRLTRMSISFPFHQSPHCVSTCPEYLFRRFPAATEHAPSPSAYTSFPRSLLLQHQARSTPLHPFFKLLIEPHIQRQPQTWRKLPQIHSSRPPAPPILAPPYSSIRWYSSQYQIV